MKRLITTLTLLAATLCAAAQEATLPTPDAKTLGMGGVAMTTLSGSHAIYNPSATAIFSQMPSQISSSYYGQGQFDYYAVTGFCRFDNVNLAQIGWRQYLRERGNNDMAVDLGYSRRIGGNWAVGVVARYMHLKRPETSADALAVDLSAAWSHPLENVGSYSTLRAGAKLGNLGGYLKDTPYTLPMVPNGMARNMAKKRTAKNGALVLADQDRILSKAWELGDCNNQFVLMIVSKEGELVFLRKGVLSEQDKADFYETIEKYK